MKMNQQEPRSYFDDAKSLLGWLTFLFQTLAMSVEPFLHGNFGSRYFGIHALAVLLVVPLYTLFWEGYDVTPLIYFMGAYVVMCAVVRLGVLVRTHRNQQIHSYYGGTPRLLRLFPRLNEITVKRGIEPLLVFLVGVFTLPYSEPLGSYLMLAAFGLFASVHLSLSYERQRVQDMNDAYIEQRHLTEQFRRMRGDPF